MPSVLGFTKLLITIGRYIVDRHPELKLDTNEYKTGHTPIEVSQFGNLSKAKHGLKIFKKEIEQIEKDISKLYLLNPPPSPGTMEEWVGWIFYQNVW